MTASLALYRILTGGLSPLTPAVFQHRLSRGKEIAGRLNERQARHLPPRPDGTLIWLHGASIGESKLLLNLAAALREKRADVHLIFTSQTISSARIVAASLPARARQQMAPVDTPAAAKRFMAHWAPDLCVVSEGEIWPNLLRAAHRSGAGTALINARMTDKSLDGWQRFARTARSIFSQFDLILAADARTASGLTRIAGTDIVCTGNLKMSADRTTSLTSKPSRDAWQFTGNGQVLLGASTHEGEEALLIKALDALPPDTCLILAPRHPDRSADIEHLIKANGVPYTRRSQADGLIPGSRILLADTFGEMERWYTQADCVYLGGGHKPGIGGHSPLEPLRFGKPVITGPHTDSFTDIHAELAGTGWVHRAQTPEDVAEAANADQHADPATLAALFARGDQAMDQTVDALLTLIAHKVDT